MRSHGYLLSVCKCGGLSESASGLSNANNQKVLTVPTGKGHVPRD